MKKLTAILLILFSICTSAQSNIETYRYGINGMVFLEKLPNGKDYVVYSVYGCRPEIRDDMGTMMYEAFKANNLGTVHFQTSLGEVVGELISSKEGGATMVDLIFTKVHLKNGKTLVYRPNCE